MKILELKIKGMTCDACTAHIERLFENKKGIKEKKVSLKNRKGQFVFDPEKISYKKIIEIINNTNKYSIINFKLQNIDDIETIKLKILGMTCDSCANTISEKFDSMQGIIEKNISYKNSEGEFSFDKNIISKAEIEAIINNTEHYRVVEEINTKKTFDYDLIIIGGGSAAFSAAIKAESLEKKTLMINEGLNFGGTCVNVGCVPSKNLIRAAEAVFRANHSNFSGVKPKGAEIDFKQIIRDKKLLVNDLQQQKYMNVVSDYKYLTLKKAWAKFLDKNTIITDKDEKFSAEKILIATGSKTKIPKIENIKNIEYLNHISLFDLENKPQSITILGAGYIALEIAMAYNRFGTKVRIIEFTDRIIRSQTADISEELQKQMINEGIEILPNYRVQKFEKNNDKIIIHCIDKNKAKVELVEKGKIVVATGTVANTSNLNLEKIGLRTSRDGHISVNKKMETNIANIYAAGDVADSPAFVYTAAKEANTAVSNAFGKEQMLMDYSFLPWVIFTDPQIAGVGIDERQAQKAGIHFEISKLELKHVPRALAAQDTRGFIKLIRNTETDKLIGARIVAPEGGELIQLLSMSIKHGFTIKELAEMMYPYLTLSEGIKLAAISFGKDVKKLSCCAS